MYFRKKRSVCNNISFEHKECPFFLRQEFRTNFSLFLPGRQCPLRLAMPGHIKLGKAGEPDPDPLPYLMVSQEMKRADMLMPYDPKKSYYCPDGKGGFMECILDGTNDAGTKANVMCGHEVHFLINCILVICVYLLYCYLFIFHQSI